MIDVSATERFQAVGETALRMVDAEVNRQAAMIGYVNDFWLMMWLTLAAVPLALMLRRQPPIGPRF